MVALHPVPLDHQPVGPAVPDSDLVIALEPDARLEPAVVAALETAAADTPADAWFGDIDIAGRTTRRPAWSPTRLLVEPTAASPLAVRASWLRAHDVVPADPALALHLAANGALVAHWPAVLSSHAAPLPGPSTADVDAHLAGLGVPASLDDSAVPPRLEPAAHFAPEISIVIPSAGARPGSDREPAIVSLLARLGELDRRHEILVVVGDEYAGDPDALTARFPAINVVPRPPGPFNFSTAVNLGILRARCELVLMLNDDTLPETPDFLERMALHLTDPSVAAVGALLVYPDGTIQHAGMVIDDARPLHPFVGWDPQDTTPHGGLCPRDVIAVTGGCLLMRRADALAVGGLSTGFPLSFNDVDLCVRLRRAVGRVVVEPNARLVHHETLTREAEIGAGEWDRWIARWGEIADPWYHPGFHRPDEPDALCRNVDHLAPVAGFAPPEPAARLPFLRSRVHRGHPTRPAPIVVP